MKIVIIGMGWYGCHLASVLKRDHDVICLEKENDLFTNAAMNNQQRLHLGFHYSFSETTRNQCLRGYEEFKRKYGQFCHSLDYNLYQVHESSNIHHDDYCKVMKEQGLYFDKINTDDYNPFHSYCENEFLNTKELVINCEKAKFYFKELLGDIIQYNKEVTSIDDDRRLVFVTDVTSIMSSRSYEYDIVINCSYYNVNKLNPYKKIEIPVKYESCFIPVIKIPYNQISMNNGLIIMDGDFISLLPIYKDSYDLENFSYFTLSSVTHTHTKTSTNISEVSESLSVAKHEDYNKHYNKIINKARQFIDLDKFDYELEEVLHSIKVKPQNDSAFSRDFLCRMEGRCINIYGGKIDTIIQAEQAVKSLLKGVRV